MSPEQKEYSKVSQEARECAKMIEMKKSGSYHGLAELSEACEQQNLQARILDEIEFDIKYVVVPKTVEIIENYVVDVIKAYLWPFRQITTDITPRFVVPFSRKKKYRIFIFFYLLLFSPIINFFIKATIHQ